MYAEVRRATPGDAAALARLRWLWHGEGLGTGRQTGDRDQLEMPWNEFCAAFASWVRYRQDTHYPFLAVHDAAPVGMGWLVVLERVPGPARWTRLGGQVQSLYVLPEHRGHGVGRTLLDTLRAEAIDLGVEWVFSHPSPAAVGLHAASGFTGGDDLVEWRP